MITDIHVQLYIGKNPWPWTDPVARLVTRGQRPPRPKFHDACDIDDSLWEVVQACWAHDPLGRPTAKRLVEWLNEVLQ